MKYRIKEYIKAGGHSLFVAQHKSFGLWWNLKDPEGWVFASHNIEDVRRMLEERKRRELATIRRKESDRLEGTRIHEVE